MRIERDHTLGQPEAIRRIDTFLDELMQRPLPSGLHIKDPNKVWLANLMNFSFKAKKGWLGTTIAGSLRVTDRSVVFDSELPAIITTFVSEAAIRNVINRELDSLLGGQC